MITTKISYLRMCLATLLLMPIFVIACVLFLRFPINDIFFLGFLFLCGLFALLSPISRFMFTYTLTKDGLRPYIPRPSMKWDEIKKAQNYFYIIIIKGSNPFMGIYFPGPLLLSNKEEVFAFIRENVPEGNPFLETINKLIWLNACQ